MDFGRLPTDKLYKLATVCGLILFAGGLMVVHSKWSDLNSIKYNASIDAIDRESKINSLKTDSISWHNAMAINSNYSTVLAQDKTTWGTMGLVPIEFYQTKLKETVELINHFSLQWRTIDKLNLHIAMLEKQNEMQKLKVRDEENQALLALSIISIVSLGGFITMIYGLYIWRRSEIHSPEYVHIYSG